MRYLVKPQPYLHGKRLKMWYRHANLVCGFGFYLTATPDWMHRPGMWMTQEQLSAFCNQVHNRR